MRKEEVKRIIENDVYNTKGYGDISGAYVKVTNIRIQKKKVIVNIKLVNPDKNQTINCINVPYSIEWFNRMIE